MGLALLEFVFQKIIFHMVMIPYVVFFSRKHLGLKNINCSQYIFGFVNPILQLFRL